MAAVTAAEVVAAISAEAAASMEVGPLPAEAVITAADIPGDPTVGWVPAAPCAAPNLAAAVPPRLILGLGRATLALATTHPDSTDSPVPAAVTLQPPDPAT
jgi:hypothetical protein